MSIDVRPFQPPQCSWRQEVVMAHFRLSSGLHRDCPQHTWIRSCSLGTLAVSYLYQHTWNSSVGVDQSHHRPCSLYPSRSSTRGKPAETYFIAFQSHIPPPSGSVGPSSTIRRSSSCPLDGMQTAPEEERLAQRSIFLSDSTRSQSPGFTSNSPHPNSPHVPAQHQQQQRLQQRPIGYCNVAKGTVIAKGR